MTAVEEFREILSYTKGMLQAYQDMGFDPPMVRRQVLLTKKEPEQGKSVAGSDMGPLTSLEDLKAYIGDCRRCKLHKGRTRLVFGEGDPRARLVFVGEAPGQDEDLAGRPFVGEAGKLLTGIIENEKAMGLKRSEVYICNVVKCRPPKNRAPEKDEVSACLAFLKEQLRLIRPEVICLLGRVAGQALFGEGFQISAERGKWKEYEGMAVMATFHPSYLLRNKDAKRQTWEDIQKVMTRLGLEVKRNA